MHGRVVWPAAAGVLTFLLVLLSAPRRCTVGASFTECASVVPIDAVLHSAALAFGVALVVWLLFRAAGNPVAIAVVVAGVLLLTATLVGAANFRADRGENDLSCRGPLFGATSIDTPFERDGDCDEAAAGRRVIAIALFGLGVALPAISGVVGSVRHRR